MSTPPPLPAGAMPPAPPPGQPGWWQRHWKWAVPLLVGFFGLLFLAAIGLFVYGLFSMMGSSDVAMEAKRRAQQDPRVIEALGQPVEPGWFIQGNQQTSGPNGRASLQIPLEGPKAEGDLYIEAVKRVGRWQYRTLTVVVDGRSTDIDLRTPDEIAAASATDEGDFSSSSDETP
ncbi:MAG: hypothetical protein KF800_09735 [Lysobacter sp.]|nr:hypothetical protein [Lysobacter sp.]